LLANGKAKKKVDVPKSGLLLQNPGKALVDAENVIIT
jgi:hypothetical protein